jgi:hypothetical protein
VRKAGEGGGWGVRVKPVMREVGRGLVQMEGGMGSSW